MKKVEEWMVEDSNFESTVTKTDEGQSTGVKEVKKPKTIGITFPGAQFGRRAFILVEMEDPSLELESWMVDNRIWKIKK